MQIRLQARQGLGKPGSCRGYPPAQEHGQAVLQCPPPRSQPPGRPRAPSGTPRSPTPPAKGARTGPPGRAGTPGGTEPPPARGSPSSRRAQRASASSAAPAGGLGMAAGLAGVGLGASPGFLLRCWCCTHSRRGAPGPGGRLQVLYSPAASRPRPAACSGARETSGAQARVGGGGALRGDPPFPSPRAGPRPCPAGHAWAPARCGEKVAGGWRRADAPRGTPGTVRAAFVPRGGPRVGAAAGPRGAAGAGVPRQQVTAGGSQRCAAAAGRWSGRGAGSARRGGSTPRPPPPAPRVGPDPGPRSFPAERPAGCAALLPGTAKTERLKRRGNPLCRGKLIEPG